MKRKDTPLMVDLRSDTLTRPTAAMREAMSSAPVGDDVYDEDPSVNALQDRACEITGKEAAIYTVTGTMANNLAIRTRCQPGDEALMHHWSHPFNYEGGSPAALSGVTVRPLQGERGLVDPRSLKAELKPEDRHFSRQKLLSVENTHNRGGGTVWPLDLLDEVMAIAKEAGLATHMDGARVFNASQASGVPVREYARRADTLSFCLSKGLGAPVGSLLCGTREVIDDARRFRHMFGGGWRQAGVIAAAGLYALDNHVDRLAEDQRRARTLAEAIEGSDGLRLLSPVETNIVVFGSRQDGVPAVDIQAALLDRGVSVGVMTCDALRAVTHLDLDDGGLATAVKALSEL